MHRKRAIVFVAWGAEYLRKVEECLNSSRLPEGEIFLVTDRSADEVSTPTGVHVETTRFELAGLARKSELFDFIPKGFQSYLFLDTDTRIIGDVTLGFEKAERHGIAAAPAPHYSLDWFWDFAEIMKREEIPLKGQLQYNTGVLFLSLRPDVIEVLKLWKHYAAKYMEVLNNDQPFLSLAMEKLEFNPYTLSPSYNYRARGELISGTVRIWHDDADPPRGLNDFERAWPPRRVENGELITLGSNERKRGGKGFLHGLRTRGKS